MVGNHTPDSNQAKKSRYMEYVRDLERFFWILPEISAISQKFLRQYICQKFETYYPTITFLYIAGINSMSENKTNLHG